MASIFTFDPDPPRVASPWSTPRSLTPRQPPGPGLSNHPSGASFATGGGLEPRAVLETDRAVTKLDAEPQEGPTEYKLHLLLRPRRSFTTSTTARHVAGSHRSSLGIPTPRSVSETAVSRTPASTPPKATSSQSRQHRLEQLTTQLLWRLQQSSPYHSTSANELVVPQLPEAAEQLRAPPSLARLLPGLEESKGALYEIGVADDGTFVGLAEDEMEESLTNLRAMAASLGCTVKVLRMIPVGECAWTDDFDDTAHSGKLWVAEAFVKPEVNGSQDSGPTAHQHHVAQPLSQISLDDSTSASEQLRVSLTGATMSGKSSLLGSLSTATLDNGRGKSRLSLLKHRHEIASGMTSSVTQELIGYAGSPDESADVNVINYASGNVDSWNDVHAACQSGRLVFLSDSAGHPRYRRTTVRGLMGWAPHWTLLCVPADNDEDTSGRVGSTPSSEEVLGAAAADVDLSEAHLELCLKLELPLIVVVTKLDLASKSGIKKTLSKLLTFLKKAGRKPSIIPDSSTTVTEDDLAVVPASDLELVRAKATDELLHDPLVVPIVLTSALSGMGIRKLHALLHEISIPPAAAPSKVGVAVQPGSPPGSKSNTPLSALYHIEDVWRLNSNDDATPEASEISIVSGRLDHGTLHLGDELLLGPYPVGSIAAAALAAEDGSDSSGSPAAPSRPSASSAPTSRSFPGAFHKNLTLPYRQASSRASKQHEWRRVRITSIRNLRLPVRTLFAGQVGSLGVLPLDDNAKPLPNAAAAATSAALSSSTSSSRGVAAAAALQGRIRKGMVLVRPSDGGDNNSTSATPPQSCRAFVARFAGEGVRNLIVGSLAVTYIASVRASAKVVAIAIDDGDGKRKAWKDANAKKKKKAAAKDDDAFGFAFDESEEGEEEEESSGEVDDVGKEKRGDGGDDDDGESTLVTFQFVATREFIEVGAQVLVMEGGRRQREVADRSERSVVGLEGFVGKVVEWFG
ncbi:HR1 repeat rho-binding protein [Lasiodiplodia theobromae]|uniref:HR1 repeat rho-binding protein n=1 Tax=Lasiodiplodia theobromae TaxID=45133 RepID=UPI0015C3FE41|nr:HR1 repeat rho-binding protein [Lasiodiplodia theobromae]KAF4533981.1 HR1 repeat rho-binding protein [Lasiodiplodia theobromae]